MRARSLWPTVAVLLILYVLTISRVSSIDAYYYFNDLEHGRLAELLHPHHLVYEVLGWVWFALWKLLGWGGRAALPLKLLSLVGAGGALLLFGRAAQRTIGPGSLAWLLTLALGLCYLPWHYATEGEPVAFFLLFGCWFLLLAVRLADAGGLSTPASPGEPTARSGESLEVTPRWAAGAGAVAGLGVLFHQALALALPVAAWCLWRAAAPARRLAAALAFLATAAAIVVVPYALAGWLATGSARPGTLAAWATGYLEEFGGRHGQARNFSLGALARGTSGAFLGGSGLKGYVFGGAGRDLGYWLALLPYAAVAAALGAGLAGLAAWRQRLPGTAQRALPGVVILALVFLAAALYWEPGNRKFWAPILPCLLLLAGWGWRAWAGGASKRMAIAAGALVMLAVALAAGNLAGGVLHKHRERDDRQVLGRRLQEVWRPGDIAVLEADRLWQAVDYHFPGLRTLPVHRYASAAFAAADTTLPAAARAARDALARGYRVYVSSPVLDELLAKLRAADPDLMPGLEPRRVFAFHDPEEPHRQAELLVLQLVQEGE